MAILGLVGKCVQSAARPPAASTTGTLVQGLRRDVEDVAAAGHTGAAGLLEEKGHGIRLVHQAQLAGRRLVVGG